MSLTLTQVKTRIASKIHGSNIDKVRDFYGLAHEAAGNILLLVDPKELIREQQISNALYDEVYSYVAPSDMNMDRIIDIRAQVNRDSGDMPTAIDTRTFDRLKQDQDYTVDFNSMVKKLKISKSLTPGVTINDCESLTAVGTWAATASAQNLEVDTLYKITGSASLKFDLAAAGSSGYIENSTFTATDLSTYEDVGSVFVWVYFSSATPITSASLRWGSSSANYWSASVTATHDATAFAAGWNLLRFDWSGATETGTPVASGVDYLRFTLAYNGTAVSTVRVDSIIVRLPSIYSLVYYSRYMFRDSSGTWLETPTEDTDLINLEHAGAENLFIYELGHIISQELQGDNGSFDVNYFKNKRDEELKAYMMRYKSDIVPKQSRYANRGARYTRR
jgi:hypothetical protein